jgi:lysophospholipase L1-like esterase
VRIRDQLARLAASLGACVALLGLGECALRLRLPDNGVTPFRAGTLEGLAFELRPGFGTRYRGFDVSVNSSGFRGPEFGPRRADELRVALVGDSFTFGNGVAFEDTLGERLARELTRLGRPATVFNCGVPGYNAGHAAITARERVLPLDIDLLVYVFFANDLEPSQARREVPVDAVIDERAGFPLRSALGQWCAVHAKRALAGAGVDVDAGTRAAWHANIAEGGPRLEAALDELRDACAERGVPLVVAIYPFMAPPETNPFAEVDAYAARVCAERGVPCVELREAFPAGSELYGHWSSTWDSHPDGAGHQRAAELLAPRLLELAPASR